jgi:hypothetical protein
VPGHLNAHPLDRADVSGPARARPIPRTSQHVAFCRACRCSGLVRPCGVDICVGGA